MRKENKRNLITYLIFLGMEIITSVYMSIFLMPSDITGFLIIAIWIISVSISILSCLFYRKIDKIYELLKKNNYYYYE